MHVLNGVSARRARVQMLMHACAACLYLLLFFLAELTDVSEHVGLTTTTVGGCEGTNQRLRANTTQSSLQTETHGRAQAPSLTQSTMPRSHTLQHPNALPRSDPRKPSPSPSPNFPQTLAA